MDDLRQALVPGKALFVKQRLFKPAFAHRHIPHNDHGAAACCNGADLGKVFFVRQAEGGGGKDNAVFQFQATVVHGAKNSFIHVRASLLLLFVKGPAAGLFRYRSGWPGGYRPQVKTLVADNESLLSPIGQGRGITAAVFFLGEKAIRNQFVQAALAVAPVQVQGLSKL